MLDEEQLDYVNSLKKTHPNVDKETLREALLGSKWTEIEIMEAISLYNGDDEEKDDLPKKVDKEQPNKEQSDDDTLAVDEEEPVIKEHKKLGKLTSIATALLIIILFIVLVIIGSMVFFQVSFSEVITFLTVDLVDNISSQF